MDKTKKAIIIAFAILLSAICVILLICFKSADVTAIYTRNSLSWKNADLLDDGALKLDLTTGKTTLQLKNEVLGRIGYNIYLYEKNDTPNECKLIASDVVEIDEKEYPPFLDKYNVRCAYRGYVDGNKKENFKITATPNTDLMLLIIIEDNNSYPKENDKPVVANIKLSAEVLLDGQYPRGDDYSFSLKDDTGAIIETVKNNDGYISFSNIAFAEIGNYVYYLSQNEGKDKKTVYDKSVYKINVVVEEKNIAKVSYETEGNIKETLPRFLNYKKNTNIIEKENIAQYPSNAKKANDQPNYFLFSGLAICVLLIICYIVLHKKRG